MHLQRGSAGFIHPDVQNEAPYLRHIQWYFPARTFKLVPPDCGLQGSADIRQPWHAKSPNYWVDSIPDDWEYGLTFGGGARSCSGSASGGSSGNGLLGQRFLAQRVLSGRGSTMVSTKDTLQQYMGSDGTELNVVPGTTSAPDEGIRDPLSRIAAATTTDKWWLHNYTPIYESHFRRIRDSVTCLLELGIGGQENPAVGGHSLRMWKQYFPNATIIGVDIHDKSEHAEDRIKILRGSQSDPAFVQQVIADYGPFDIVIDDGSHFSPDVVASLELLWPAVRQGGFYVVEDIQCAYNPEFAKTSDLDAPDLSVNVIARLIRALNAEAFEGAVPGVTAAFADGPRAIHAYQNIILLEKGPPPLRRAMRGGAPSALAAALAAVEAELATSDAAGLQYTRAVILNRMGKHEAADAAIAAAVKDEPDNPEYLHFYGNLKTQQQKFAAAIELQRRAIAASPGNPHFHDRLALALLKIKDFTAALQEAEKAVQLSPGNPLFHGRRAAVLEALRRKEEASVTAKQNSNERLG
jgi:Flp pilus assembly protein TadD